MSEPVTKLEFPHVSGMEIPGTPTNQRLFRQIERLGKSKNLTAAIIHLNDTYLIDERRFGAELAIPGMARIASLVATVRRAVSESCGQDRTIVVHSGDFLSPSRLGKTLKGEAMTDILGRLPLRFATLGNHEFDFGTDVLAQRLQQATFETLIANLRPPPNREKDFKFSEIVFWPTDDPLIAFTGLMSEEVAKSAVSQGFIYESWRESLFRVCRQVEEQKACKLVVLSHFSQADDRDLAQTIGVFAGQSFRNRLILGGHDHDIDWAETSLSKNLSNCRSVTVFLVPTDSLEWGVWEAAVSLDDKLFSNAPLSVHRRLDSHRPSELGLEGTFPEDAPNCIGHLPAKVAEAYMRRLHWAAQDGFSDNSRQSLRDVIEYANLSDDDIYGEKDFSGRYPLYVSKGDLSYVPDSDVQKAVDLWEQKGKRRDASASAGILRDLSRDTATLDARDDSLRSGSTDFGNFIVDCIRRSTRADVALMNAGAFRADMSISPIITQASLEEVFLYDDPKAVITLPVAGTELDAILKHSDRESGNGRVLQRTGNAASHLSHAGPITLAIVAFLLCDESDFDGYARVLSSARGIPVDTLRKEMATRKDLTGRSIISLFRDSANEESYSRDVRFSLRLESPEEQDVSHALELIKAYRAACAVTGLELRFWNPVLHPQGNSSATYAPDPLPLRVIETRQELYEWVEKKVAENGQEYLFDIREKLRAHPESLRTNEPFHSHLYAVVMQALMRGPYK